MSLCPNCNRRPARKERNGPNSRLPWCVVCLDDGDHKTLPPICPRCNLNPGRNHNGQHAWLCWACQEEKQREVAYRRAI